MIRLVSALTKECTMLIRNCLTHWVLHLAGFHFDFPITIGLGCFFLSFPAVTGRALELLEQEKDNWLHQTPLTVRVSLSTNGGVINNHLDNKWYIDLSNQSKLFWCYSVLKKKYLQINFSVKLCIKSNMPDLSCKKPLPLRSTTDTLLPRTVGEGKKLGKIKNNKLAPNMLSMC